MSGRPSLLQLSQPAGAETTLYNKVECFWCPDRVCECVNVQGGGPGGGGGGGGQTSQKAFCFKFHTFFNHNFQHFQCELDFNPKRRLQIILKPLNSRCE